MRTRKTWATKLRNLFSFAYYYGFLSRTSFSFCAKLTNLAYNPHPPPLTRWGGGITRFVASHKNAVAVLVPQFIFLLEAKVPPPLLFFLPSEEATKDTSI